ncbi:MAG: hypothetical protein ACKVZ0_24150 [Gemmatimonadales bacterium]
MSVHDRYTTLGPDGKLYPTWHPPVEPGINCTFGHEHGRDPRGSSLYLETGPIPFGYANEVLEQHDPANPRHEDHVGHKIEWEDGMIMRVDGAPISMTCSVLTKLHQGTHSKDAFTNNLHELAYHLRCSDGSAMSLTLMTPIGAPGEFVRSCDREVHVTAGLATPANSPVGNGKRVIADRGCVEQFVLVPSAQTSRFDTGVRESWQVSARIRQTTGRYLVIANPYFQVLNPSRFHDPALPNAVGRTIDLCYETEPNGDRARGGGCLAATNNGLIAGITWNDPRSTFTGAARFVDINTNRITNAGGPAVWYTDPFGRNARPEAFPGSIKQMIAMLDNTTVPFTGPVIGRDRSYGGHGVHAPN